MLRINAARISVAMTLQPLLAGILAAYPEVQIEIRNDEGYVDIVEKGFDASIRLGESVQKDMVAVPLGGPVAVAVVGSPDHFSRHPVPRRCALPGSTSSFSARAHRLLHERRTFYFLAKLLLVDAAMTHPFPERLAADS